ncbi:MAG: hypothetical protein ABW318_24295 [Vicinamibacterales bacterium]
MKRPPRKRAIQRYGTRQVFNLSAYRALAGAFFDGFSRASDNQST